MSAGPGLRSEDADALLEILAGRGRAQALSTAAALGLPELLADGPRTVDELARASGCDEAKLDRLLLVLVGLACCERDSNGRYRLTDRGEWLRESALGPLATFLGSADQWGPWASLRESLGPGAPSAFEHFHGTDLYAYLRAHPREAALYDRAIDAFTRQEARGLCDSFDFSSVGTLVDVGGGRGTLLVEVLSRWPHVRGILLDLPHVVRAARPELPAHLADRLEVLEGDFHQALPSGGDTYLLKHVLHNWADERAAALLRRCAEAAGPEGRVLVVESLLMPHAETNASRLLDLEMLVLTEGRERRKPELRRLFGDAGLALVRSRAITPWSWLFEGQQLG